MRTVAIASNLVSTWLVTGIAFFTVIHNYSTKGGFEREICQHGKERPR
jgi:hypothetical protein